MKQYEIRIIKDDGEVVARSVYLQYTDVGAILSAKRLADATTAETLLGLFVQAQPTFETDME